MENKEIYRLSVFLKWMFGFLAFLFLVILFWFMWKSPAGKGITNLKEIDAEFLKIKPPPYTYELNERRAIDKVSSAWVSQFYATKMVEIDIHTHYDRQLIETGWLDTSDKYSGEWTYCKGRFRARVAPKKYLEGYTFIVGWFNRNGDKCP